MLPGRHPRPTRLCRVALGLVLCGVAVGCSHTDKLPSPSDRPAPAATRLPSPNNVDASAKPGPASAAAAAAAAADAAAALKVPPANPRYAKPQPQTSIGVPPAVVDNSGTPPTPGQQSPMGNAPAMTNNVATFSNSPAQPQATLTGTPSGVGIKVAPPQPPAPPTGGGTGMPPIAPVLPPPPTTISPPQMPVLSTPVLPN